MYRETQMAEYCAEADDEVPDNSEETAATLIIDWLAASTSSLREVWDNEEDAVYDSA